MGELSSESGVRTQLWEGFLVALHDKLVGWFLHLLEHFLEIGAVGVDKQLELFAHEKIGNLPDLVQEVVQVLQPLVDDFERAAAC